MIALTADREVKLARHPQRYRMAQQNPLPVPGAGWLAQHERGVRLQGRNLCVVLVRTDTGGVAALLLDRVYIIDLVE